MPAGAQEDLVKKLAVCPAWYLPVAFLLTIPVWAQEVGQPPRVASAQSAPPPQSIATAPPVEELVAAALDRSPALASLRARLQAAREMVAPAGALPELMTSVSLQDVSFPKWTVGSEEMSMVSVEVQQGLLYPGKRDARREAARAEVMTRDREMEQLQRQLASQVRSIYGRVYVLDREKRALDSARQLLDLLQATSASRYSVGETEQEPVIKAQLEISRLDERLDDLTSQRRALVAALNRLLDRAGDMPLGEVQALPPVAVPTGPWEDIAEANSAAVAVRQAQVQAAERRLAAARLELKPNLFAASAVGIRGTLPPVVTLNFGVEWPAWKKDKQEPLVRAAEREVEAAKADLRDEQASVQTEAARLRAEWDQAERQMLRYRQAILPQTSTAMDAARVAYLNGRGDFSTVVEDFREWLEARVGLAKREADRFAVWAQVQALTSQLDPGRKDGGR
jgi:cobalt-zinc-cadmium efflux system outer membrane protein